MSMSCLVLCALSLVAGSISPRLPFVFCWFKRSGGLFIPLFFFFNDTATTEIYTLSLHDALPIFGFHKQMDNRIKLLEEILSFRMQGVEFDNGDMYVDGHKAASDVRDEFVSVTEKLM